MKSICGYYDNGIGWFRIFGYGLKFKDSNRHSLLFSERYRYTKWLRKGHWYIGLLKPDKMVKRNIQKTWRENGKLIGV